MSHGLFLSSGFLQLQLVSFMCKQSYGNKYVALKNACTAQALMGWLLGRDAESPVLAFFALAALPLQVTQSLHCTATVRKPISLFFICCSSPRYPEKCSIPASIKHLSLTPSVRFSAQEGWLLQCGIFFG